MELKKAKRVEIVCCASSTARRSGRGVRGTAVCGLGDWGSLECKALVAGLPAICATHGSEVCWFGFRVLGFATAKTDFVTVRREPSKGTRSGGNVGLEAWVWVCILVCFLLF